MSNETATPAQERLIEVAEWLEAGAPHRGTMVGFDLSDTIADVADYKKPPCGTICCIAGAIVQFEHERLYGKMADSWHTALNVPFVESTGGVLDAAAMLTNLTEDEADELFCPDKTLDIPYSKVTPAHAAQTIRGFLETGVVDWSGAPPHVMSGKEKLQEVLDWLEDDAPEHDSLKGFNMALYIDTPEGASSRDPKCGTICCMGGALVQFEIARRSGAMAGNESAFMNAVDGKLLSDLTTSASITETAAKIADITYDQAAELFIPHDYPFDSLEQIPVDHAAAVLRKFIRTGEIDWMRNLYHPDYNPNGTIGAPV